MIYSSLSAIDPIISEMSLLKHPFYVKWTRGELTMDDMNIYAKEYYALAKAVPGIVKRIYDRVPENKADMKDQIFKNMKEEQEHVTLWERFAKSMGIEQAELDAYQPSMVTTQAIAELEKAAEESFESGVVAMYAFESELPAIAQTKKDGLNKFYGLTSEDAHIYFDEHLGEEAHLKVWRNISVDSDIATRSAIKSLKAQNRVLDAVCEKAGMSLAC